MRRPLLQVRELTKTFPGLRALDALSLDVHGGEIVAVVGQNGSGKSTLVKILAGVYVADAGEVDVADASGEVLSGAAALQRLRFVHQDLGLIPTLSTIENLDLSRPLGAGGLAPLRTRAERQNVRTLIERFGESFDIDAPIARLTAAEQRVIGIARALSDWRHADNVLVLDEPTVALPPNEVGRLFDAVRRVAAEGAGIIFISHRLDEVLDLADRIVVLRDGRLVADVPSGEVDHDELVRLITGRQLANLEVEPRRPLGSSVLSVRHLSGETVADVSFELAPREIVGVGGLLGSGHEHLARLVFGATTRNGGEITVAGAPLRSGDPVRSIEAGLAHIPADRRGAGAVMEMSARENLTLPHLQPLRRFLGRLDVAAERREANAWSDRVGLSPPDPERPLATFSGGNQQKVVLAKWLRNEPRVLLLDEPTQGVDVGAKASIYTLVIAAARQGAAVLVASADMKELSSLCDRVLVMREGRVAVELTGASLTEVDLVSASLGLRRESAERLFGEQPSPSDPTDSRPHRGAHG